MNPENQTEETNPESSIQEETLNQSEAEPITNAISDDQVVKLEEALSESKDKYLRLYSEFENFRRRTSKEKMDLISTANEQLMVSLISIVDDIDRAKTSLDTTTDVNSLREGINLIFGKFHKVLESKGLKPLESKNTPFNPDLHEAITQIPAPSEELKGKVVDEIEKGYYLNEKLIRVAKVVIGA